MSIPVPLRSDYDAVALRRLARQSDDAAQTRRLLALGAIYAGSTRSEAAALGGVGVQIVRDWVVRFNAEGPDGHCQTNAVSVEFIKPRGRRSPQNLDAFSNL